MKENYKLEDLLMCPRCGMPFIHAIDKKTEKLSKYLYKPDCKCYKKSIVIAVG